MADAISVVDNWLDAIEAGDIQRVTDMLADNVTVEAEMVRTPMTGKKLIPAMMRDTLSAIESLRIDRKKLIASGRDVAILARLRATFGNDLEIYGEKLPTSGKSLDILAAIFVEVNAEGKISRITRVRDTFGVIQQLGISPERMAALKEKFDRQRRAA